MDYFCIRKTMSIPNKKIKTDFGSIFLGGEVDDDQKQNERKQKVNHEESTILAVSRTCLLNLNDEYLIEIFERCALLDWCSIAQSCKRFKKIIFQLFGQKHKILKLNFSDIVCVKTTVEARRFFATFGSLITELEIIFEEYKKDYEVDIIETVSRWCTSLKSIKISEFNIPDNEKTFIAIRQLFERLQTIHLIHVFTEGCDSWDYYKNDGVMITENGNYVNFFNNCSSLMDLKLLQSDCYFYNEIYKQTFVNLEHFSIEDWVDSSYEDSSYSAMNGFVTRHLNLKTLSLDCENSHLPDVAATCKSLQTLGFKFDCKFPHPSQTYVDSLTGFINLKQLTCFAVRNEDNMSRLVKVLPKLANSLELLDLRYGCVTQDLIQIVSSMKRLKVFRMYHIFSESVIDLNPLAEMIELNELSLHNCYTNDKNGTNECDLVKIVNRLEKLSKLKFYVNDYKIQRETYLQLLNCVQSRPANKQHLVMDCPTTDDFKDLLRAAVKIVKGSTVTPIIRNK